MLLLEMGRVSYERAWQLQHRLVRARQQGKSDDVLILLEHDPVITLGRAADQGHILATTEQLLKAGIHVHRVERGGDVTYHGPGQLVGYPILLLTGHRLGPSQYMHRLEEVLIRTLRDFGLEAERRDGLIGVWVHQRKIAALGARIEQGVSYHGFALNVAPDLQHFGLIVPCGLTGVQVTSIEHELGRRVRLSAVGAMVAMHFAEVFDVCLQRASPQQLAW